MVAASMLGFASIEGPQGLLPRESGRLDPPLRTAAGPVVALGHQQFGEEAPVGHLILHRPVGDVGELVADRRQSQEPAGAVDGGVGGLLGQASLAGQGH